METSESLSRHPRGWADWRWQLRHCLRTAADFDRVVRLTPAERAAFANPGRRFPVAVTPYYAELLDPANPADPLRRTMLPTPAESVVGPGEFADPLAEDDQSPVPGVVHRYPDRVLFLATGQCAVYCRYCTRSRRVGRVTAWRPSEARWRRALAYIAAHPEIHDVLISGGDPLLLADAQLEWLLARLHAIPHLDYVRLGTKVPFVLPMRVTPALCRLLRRYPPLFFSLHATHPRELTPAARAACAALADAGVVLGSQTVLLKGVNDDPETLRTLWRGLLRCRVRPYYLLQCDPVAGSARFRTPVRRGVAILRALRGRLSGYAIPSFMVDLPGGGGKVPLLPDYLVGRAGPDWIFRQPGGTRRCRYRDAAPAPRRRARRHV